MAYYSQGHFVKTHVERGQALWLSNTLSTKAAKRGEGCFRVKKAMGFNRDLTHVMGENAEYEI